MSSPTPYPGSFTTVTTSLSQALVRTALQTDPDPGGGPQGRLFVPVSVAPRSSSGATRPGSLVILAPSVLSPCSNDIFGGHL